MDRAGVVRGRALHEGGHEAPQEVGLLELTGARRRGSASHLVTLGPLRLACALAALTVGGGAFASVAHAGSSPRPTDLRCIEGCAGKQIAAAHSLVRITGSGLKHVVEVSFRGRSGRIDAGPAAPT